MPKTFNNRLSAVASGICRKYASFPCNALLQICQIPQLNIFSKYGTLMHTKLSVSCSWLGCETITDVTDFELEKEKQNSI